MIPKKPALGLDPRVADFSDKIMHQTRLGAKLRFDLKQLCTSILVRVVDFAASHDDGEWPQRVLDLHGAGMMSQHVRKTAVGLRRLVEISAQQRDAAVP